MSNPAFSQFLRRWARGGRPAAAPARAARPAKLRVEEFEARLVPANDLPTPQVLGSTVVVAGFREPTVAVDPTDPNTLVMVSHNGTYLIAHASLDGGTSWFPFFDTNQSIGGPAVGYTQAFRLQDPALDRFGGTRDTFKYTTTSGTSIAFARDGGVYITAVESNAARTSGAVVLYAFDYVDPTPTPLVPQPRPVIRDLDPDGVNDSTFRTFAAGLTSDANVLYRWLGQDPVYNTAVAVNTNLATFTDPQTNQTVTDTNVGKAVYVAYNTNVTTSGFAEGAAVAVVNPASVLVQASSDGGFHFSTPVLANDFGYNANPATNQGVSAVLPQIGFTPTSLRPDNTVAPGRLTFGWQTLQGGIAVDASSPDNGQAARPAVTASGSTRVDLNAAIRDATPPPQGAPAGTPDTPGITTIPFTVDLVGAGNLDPADIITDLDLQLAVYHETLSELRISVTNPLGQEVVLLFNRKDGLGNDNNAPAGLPDAPAAGLPTNTRGLGVQETNPPDNQRLNFVGTTFDDEAARHINDPANLGPYGYRVQTDSFGGRLRTLYSGRTAAELTGEWALTFRDVEDSGDPGPARGQFLAFVDVKASAYISNSRFSTDRAVTGAQNIPVDPTGASSDKPVAIHNVPTATIGSGVDFAFDNTLGAYTRFGGRLYAAYTAPTRNLAGQLIETNIFVRFSDDGGVTWSTPTRVNDDNVSDHFSEGRRLQFSPSITVDQATGSVVITWYDGRNDAANDGVTFGARVATYIATSNDGGRTFSTRLEGGIFDNQNPSNQTWLNPTKTAIDAVTGEIVNLEPIPSNFTLNNTAATAGPGIRQAIVAYAGKAVPVWTGNLNALGTNVYATSVAIAAGPRVIAADMGPVVRPANAGGPVGTYNNTPNADGVRQVDGFTVTFDRPVDTTTFTPADVEVRFRGAGTQLTANGQTLLATLIPVAEVVALDPQAIPGFPTLLNATRFFVRFANPQAAIGTYSYAVGPEIFDRARTVGGVTLVTNPAAPFNAPFLNTADVFIPDLGQATSTITVPALPAGQVVGDVSVRVSIDHSFVGDLRLTLVSPDGSRAILANRRGGGGSDFVNTRFDDQARVNIGDGAAPFTGVFRPEQGLAIFNGLAAAGTWTLLAEDLTSGDTGFIREFELFILPGRDATAAAPRLGNPMDQNANGQAGSFADDRFSAPYSLSGTPFTLPYQRDTLPLIVPGPHVVGTAAPGQPATTDNLVLNSHAQALDLVFDRDIVPTTFTRGNVLRITGPAGEIVGTTQFPITVTPVVVDANGVTTATGAAALNPANGGARRFRIGFPPQVLSGTYSIEVGPNPADQNPLTNTVRAVDQPRLVTFLPANSTTVTVDFDRDITRAVTPADVVRVTGPDGAVAGPFAIAPVAGNPRRFTVTLPAVATAGQYLFEFAPDLRVPAVTTGPTNANLNPLPLIDTNLNAGVDILRGGNSATGTLENRRYSTPAVSNVTIPANGTAELRLFVPDAFLVQQDPPDDADEALNRRRTIQLALNVQFPNVPDLRGVLVSPDGFETVLFDGPGTQGDPNQANFAGTVFDDFSDTPISTAEPPFNPAAGTFNPQEPFSRLAQPNRDTNALGFWTVRIENSGNLTGVLQNFTLTLPQAVAGTGLGEAVADRTGGSFRIFTQDPSDPLTRQQWTPVGPAAANPGAEVDTASFNRLRRPTDNENSSDQGFNSGRVTGLAVDPSDPSGNTVYAGGASGGVWKTTNFLTADVNGPHWQPLTDFGPTFSLNIGSIAVFGRNNDTTQSVIIAATGEGDVLGTQQPSGPGTPSAPGLGTVSTPGVGFIISADGGKTWRLLDSTNNVDANGNYLPIESTDRNRRFVGTVAFKVVIDPTPTPNGDLIFYAALSDGAARPAGSPSAGGVWRSNDTGKTWVLAKSGQATDLVLAAGSAQNRINPEDPNLSRSLQELYASFSHTAATPGGVYFTSQATSATEGANPQAALVRVNGGQQNPLYRDFDFFGFPQVFVEPFPDVPRPGAPGLTPPLQPDRTPSSTVPSPPGVLKGRVSLAAPEVSNDPIRNLAYRGWIYALVSGRGGNYDGLYMSKDFGRNWTRVQLSEYRPGGGTGANRFVGYGSNNTGAPIGPRDDEGGAEALFFPTVPDHDLFAGEQGNFANAIAVDPTNPYVVYIGGSSDLRTRQPLGGFVRVDTRRLTDAQNLTAYSNSNPDYNPLTQVPGTLQFDRYRGSVIIRPDVVPFNGPGGLYGIAGPTDLTAVNTGYISAFRDPSDPFNDATLLLTNIQEVQNRGFNAVQFPMDANIETNVHRIVTFVDPLTGKTRLIVGDDQGIASVVDEGDGRLETDGIGFADAPSKVRTGNMQISQFYYGAAQPSQLAADIAQSLFYGNSDDNGYPKSPGDILQTGATGDWTYFRPNQTNPADQPGPVGFTGNGIATDAVGSGTSYEFRWPERGGDLTNFFRVIRPTDGQEGVSRTNGLLQDRRLIRDINGNLTGVADDPFNRAGQFPGNMGANFAVNPINRNAIVMSAPGNNQGSGRLFRTTDQGLNWFVIGDTPNIVGAFGAVGEFGPGLDGTYSQAVAFGSPDPLQPAILDNFIYAGTQGGRVFVTRTGTGPWLNITAGRGNVNPLDGSAVQAIVTNPTRGRTDVFVVTLRGVYYKRDAFDQAAGWTNITGNLFQLQKPGFPDPTNPADPTLTLKYLSSIAADWRFAIPVNPNDPQSPTYPILYVGGEGGVFRSGNFGETWNYFPAASQYTDLDTGLTYTIPDGGYLPNVHVTDLDLSLGNIDPANGLPDQSQTGGLNMLVATTYGRGSFAIRLDNVLPPNTFVSGPRVTRLINPNPVNGPSNRLRLEFNTAVNPTSFTAADVSLTDAAGNPIPVLGIVPVPNPKPDEPNRGSDLLNLYDILFTPVTTSTAVSVVVGFNPPSPNNPTPNTPLISDFGGNLLNQNNNLLNGEALVDQYRTTIVLSSGVTNNRLVVSTSPATAVAGVPQTVVIEARDEQDRILTGVSGVISLSAAGAGTFSPAQVNLVNGRAEFSITFTTAVPTTVLATLSGPVDANGTAFTTQVVAAAPTQFVITPASTVVTISTAAPTVNVGFNVQAFDAFGNPALYTGPVTVAASDDSPAVVLPGPVQLVNGAGTFSATFAAQGTATLTVSGPDLVTPANPPLTGTATVVVNAGSASRLEVTVPAGPFVIGDTLEVTVRALDAAGNVAALNGPFVPTIGDPAAVFTPARPSFVNGVARFNVTVGTPGTYTVTVNAGALTGSSGPLTVLAAPPRPSPTELLPGVTAVGSGPGGSPVVQVVNEDGSLNAEILPFPPGFNNEVDPLGPGFTGGLRTAVADVTGDGVPDYVIGTGPGITAFVQVVDGKTNEAVLNFQPFADFKGGVFVAAGDITGDGVSEVVITPDEGGGPRVTVLRGRDFVRVANFFGIADPNFRGGARPAVGDINGDGNADLVIAAGFGGGPRVSIFDGAALTRGAFVRPVGDFFVFEEALRNGAYVSVGDVNGDGFGDLISGAGPGGGPRVLVLDGRQLLTEGSDVALAAPMANFFAGDTENRGGVRLAVKNIDKDRFTDVVTGAGEGGGSGVTAYKGSSLAQGAADPLYAFDALADFPGGVFVG